MTEKGFYTPAGYMGLVAGQWRLFVSESEYYEYLNDLFKFESEVHQP